jgi:hypothetical protein
MCKNVEWPETLGGLHLGRQVLTHRAGGFWRFRRGEGRKHRCGSVYREAAQFQWQLIRQKIQESHWWAPSFHPAHNQPGASVGEKVANGEGIITISSEPIHSCKYSINEENQQGKRLKQFCPL